MDVRGYGWGGWRGAAAAAGAALLLAAGAVGAPAGAAAQAERPGLDESREFVAELVDRGLATWRADHPSDEDRTRAMHGLVHEYFDVKFITRGVLGKYARKIGAEDRQVFGDLFSEFVLAVYLPYLSQFDRERLRLLDARARGKRDTVVRSEFRTDEGAWVGADWRVRRTEDGLRVIDLVVEGVSLLLTQRQEFEAKIRESGFDGLIEDLRTRLAAAAASG